MFNPVDARVAFLHRTNTDWFLNVSVNVYMDVDACSETCCSKY